MNLFAQRLGAAALLLSASTLSCLAAAELSVTFGDEAWTGEAVPENQQCQRFGGKEPQSPELLIENIPAEADALILEFSDRTFARMDKGGHGKVGYKIEEGAEKATVPPVPGHTENLPEKFFMVAAHQAPTWDKPGAYLPPCSGGRGNNYFIDVKAVKLGEDQAVVEVLDQGAIKLATY